MNFDEIQSLWAAQQPANFCEPAVAKHQGALVRALKRRQRFLGYGVFISVAGLILTPLLSFANYMYAPEVGTPLYWTKVTLSLLVLAASAVFVVRQIQRHRALSQVRSDTLRQQAEVSLASLDAELRDYRRLPWAFGLWISLAVLSIYVNAPFHGGGVAAVSLRIGIVVGFCAVAGAVFWRHYRENLRPAYLRQQEILRQLG